MLITHTERGAPRLRCKGYDYRLHRLSETQPLKFWRCKHYNSKKCKARIILANTNNVELRGFHNHDIDIESGQAVYNQSVPFIENNKNF